MITLTLDQSDQALLHVEWRDHQLLQARITGETGQGVENDRDLFGQLRIAAQQTEVGINARRALMIIAGAEMNVTPDLVGIAPDDEQQFAMRF